MCGGEEEPRGQGNGSNTKTELEADPIVRSTKMLVSSSLAVCDGVGAGARFQEGVGSSGRNTKMEIELEFCAG